MLYIKSIGIVFFNLISLTVFSQTQFPTNATNENNAAKQTTIQKTSLTPVTIFYGLNESHSNSWAKCTKKGLVGISYFKRNNISSTEGQLIYKTIQPDNTENEETVTTGSRLEISVLLFDSQFNPHIFAANSNSADQVIIHYYKNNNNQWVNETILHFMNEGGKHIYELSADIGPDNSFHLIVLKTRSNPDSDDYYYAFADSHLFHISNVKGSWQKELVHHYNMIWTLDEYVKALNRQDIKVDKDGFIHVVFGEQINAMNSFSPSRLCYANNKTGRWVIETAINYLPGTRDDAGWFPSLCLDNDGIPNISSTYFGRVSTGSAAYAKLLFLKRLGNGTWSAETVASNDNGYHGTDGREYTGGLTHLVFDKYNKPNIIFTDIASSHAGMNYLNLGNIRYAIKNNNTWNISTVYQQPLPRSFFNATEMYGICLLISDGINKIQVIGQQLVVNSSSNYSFELIHKIIQVSTVNKDELEIPTIYKLDQNYPNPFNPTTAIQFAIPFGGKVSLKVFDVVGREMANLIDTEMNAGQYKINFDATKLPSGMYIYRLVSNKINIAKKMMFVK